MLPHSLQEKVRNAGRALDGATSDNIIELCKQYLALLGEYRAELYRFAEALGISQWSGLFILEDAGNVRKAIRVAVEGVTRERNRAEALLHSFTAVSGYEAVETLNRVKYKGRDDWALSAGGAGCGGGTDGERMTVQETVDVGSRLRREEHVARSAAPGPASR